jgi:aerobic-type carbon monoxide dehydrogenase small subunit (CoxS/CutS family)
VTPSEAGLRVNATTVDLSQVPDDERLLDTIRWRIGLKGTKEGCRTGDCGACTVLVDGRTVLSCLTLTHEVEGATVTTIEGTPGDPDLERARAAFERAGALQCGYCTPGFVVALAGLLKERGPDVTSAELLDGLQGNLCRCTGYAAIVRAVTGLEGPPR